MEEEYKYLKTLFKIESRSWSMIHENYSSFIFCDANKKYFIAEYLLLEDFVQRARKVHFIYYYGIDLFLKEFRTLVYNCLK